MSPKVEERKGEGREKKGDRRERRRKEVERSTTRRRDWGDKTHPANAGEQA